MTAAPDCMLCAHSVAYRGPDGKVDFSKKICVRMPPTPVALPAGPNQMMIQPLNPIVGRGMLCGCFEPKDASDEVAGPAEDGEKSH